MAKLKALARETGEWGSVLPNNLIKGCDIALIP